MVKGGGIGGSKHREINLDGFPLTKSPVIDFAISREILIVLPMYFLKRETIEILVIEGASGILDFLLYSHCTQ